MFRKTIVGCCAGAPAVREAVIAELIQAGFSERQLRVSRPDARVWRGVIAAHFALGAAAGAVIGLMVILIEAFGLISAPFVISTPLAGVPDVLLNMAAEVATSMLVGGAVGTIIVFTLWPRRPRGSTEARGTYEIAVRVEDEPQAQRATAILSEWSAGKEASHFSARV